MNLDTATGLGDEYGYDFELIPMYPKDVEPWEPNLHPSRLSW